MRNHRLFKEMIEKARAERAIIEEAKVQEEVKQ